MKYKLLFLALGMLTGFQLFAVPSLTKFSFNNTLSNSSALYVSSAGGQTTLSPVYEFNRIAVGSSYEDVTMTLQLILTTNGAPDEALGDPVYITSSDFSGTFTNSAFIAKIKTITISNQKLLAGRLQLKFTYLNYSNGATVENRSVTTFGTTTTPPGSEGTFIKDEFYATGRYEFRQKAHVTPPANAWFPSETTPVMRKGDKLLSNNGQYALNFQSTDGNLVLSNTITGAVLWSIQQTGGTYLMFHKDGNLLMHTNNGYNWTSDIYVAGKDFQGTNRVYIVLQDDGNLVMEWDGGNYTDIIGASATGGGINSNQYGRLKIPKL